MIAERESESLFKTAAKSREIMILMSKSLVSEVAYPTAEKDRENGEGGKERMRKKGGCNQSRRWCR